MPMSTGGKAELEGTMATEISSGPVVRQLYHAGYVVEVETAPKKIVPVIQVTNCQTECWQQERTSTQSCKIDPSMPVPGKYYRLASISAEAGLIHKSRCHPIYCHDVETQNIIIISNAYKNDEDSIRKYLQRIDEVERGNDRPFFYFFTVSSMVLFAFTAPEAARSCMELIVRRPTRTVRMIL